MLTCFHLMEDCAAYFRPETIVASFLHFMVLFYKVIFNHTSETFVITTWIVIARSIQMKPQSKEGE